MNQLTWQGFGLRFVFAAILVFASYNPSGYSFFHWIKNIFPAINPYIALAGLALIIGWAIYLRATLRSLGLVGIGLVLAVCGCLIWLMFDLGVLSLERSSVIAWVILVFQSLVLAIGMSWSHIRRRMSGQVDADDVDDN